MILQLLIYSVKEGGRRDAQRRLMGPEKRRQTNIIRCSLPNCEPPETPKDVVVIEANAFVCSVCRIFIGGSTTHKIKINQN